MKRIPIVACAILLMASACAAIPTSGPVHVVEQITREDGGIILDPKGPTKDATPEQLIDGFLQASSAGYGDAFETARQYLTPEAAAQWNPSAQVRVYPDSTNTNLSRSVDGGVRVSVPTLGVVDSAGSYVETRDESMFSADFALVKDANKQWRIGALNDGVLMQESLFSSFFVRSRLYFLNPTNEYLVPSVRWFPRSNALTLMVQGVLSGPPRQMSNSTHSALPSSVNVEVQDVTLQDGVVQINMSSSLQSVDDSALKLFDAQLRNTITGSGLAQESVLYADGVRVIEGKTLQLPAYPFPSASLVALRAGEYVQYQNDSPVSVGHGNLIEHYKLRDIAVPYGDATEYIVALNKDRKEMYYLDLAQNQVQKIAQGSALVPPSIDVYGWIWTTESVSDGRIRVLDPSSFTEDVFAVNELAGQRIRAIAVSREGSRIAVAYGNSAEENVSIFGIQRDSTGRPTGMSAPFNVGQSVVGVRDMAWMGDAKIAVLTAQDDVGTASALYQVDLGGPTVEIPAIDNAVNVAAGRGSDSIVLMTHSGSLYRLMSGVWSRYATDVAAIALPG